MMQEEGEKEYKGKFFFFPILGNFQSLGLCHSFFTFGDCLARWNSSRLFYKLLSVTKLGGSCDNILLVHVGFGLKEI